MRIEDMLGSTYAEEITTKERRQKEIQEDSLALYGGRDTVNISPEARERLAAVSAKDSGQQTAQDGETAEGEEGASGAQGASGSGSSGTSQLEALEKQLKELQSKYQKVASDSSIPPEEKEAQLGAIQAQMSQLTSQIAELKSQQGAA